VRGKLLCALKKELEAPRIASAKDFF
jgi:hypothetical protein